MHNDHSHIPTHEHTTYNTRRSLIPPRPIQTRARKRTRTYIDRKVNTHVLKGTRTQRQTQLPKRLTMYKSHCSLTYAQVPSSPDLPPPPRPCPALPKPPPPRTLPCLLPCHTIVLPHS